jgi:hypothetical protein
MGLTVSVMRQAEFGDCSNNGVSARFSRLTLINVEGPFDPREDAPAAKLEQHRPGCLRVVPVGVDGWKMFGGNYAACSDSRFSEACEELLGHRFYGAVAIHDRVES